MSDQPRDWGLQFRGGVAAPDAQQIAEKRIPIAAAPLLPGTDQELQLVLDWENGPNLNDIVQVGTLPAEGETSLIGARVRAEAPLVGEVSEWVCLRGGTVVDTPWQPGQTIVIGDLRYSDVGPEKAYRATSAGTTSLPAPSGTTTATDGGGVAWEYVATLAVWRPNVYAVREDRIEWLISECRSLFWVGDGRKRYGTEDTANAESGVQWDTWINLAGTTDAAQSSDTAQPTIVLRDNDYVATFDGTGDWMTIPTLGLSTATAFTLFVGVEFPTDAATQQALISCDNNDLLLQVSSDAMRVYITAGNYAEFEIAEGRPFLFVVRYDGAGATNADRLRIWQDGQELNVTHTGTIPAAVPALSAGRVAANSASGDEANCEIYLFGWASEAWDTTWLDAGGQFDAAVKSMINWRSLQ